MEQNSRLTKFRSGTYASAITDFKGLEKQISEAITNVPFYFALNTINGVRVYYVCMCASENEGQFIFKFYRDFTTHVSEEMSHWEDFFIKAYATSGCTDEEKAAENTDISQSVRGSLTTYVMHFLDAAQAIARMPY